MEPQEETNEVLKEFNKAKPENKQPLCPHCQEPLQAEQTQYVSNYWKWNSKTKRYERDEPDLKDDELFCKACRAEYFDSLYR